MTAEVEPLTDAEWASLREESRQSFPDPHYLGVVGTRKRAVSQLEITVEEGGDSALDHEMAERVRTWLKRGELTEELFDILDAIGKGYSFTEILWDTSSGQWEPKRLEWRDPRWFRFDRKDLRSPLLLGDGGQEKPLLPGQFIFSTMREVGVSYTIERDSNGREKRPELIVSRL